MRRSRIDATADRHTGVPASSAAALVALGGLGVGMIVPAMYLARRYPLAPHANELTDLGKLSGYTHASFWRFVVILLVWFICYTAGILVARRCEQRAAFAVTLVAAAVAGLLLVTMYPVNATDMAMYAARSRLFTTYHVDPIAVTPDTFSSDPWMRLVSPEWSGHTSPYGPLWTLIAAPITWLAGDNLLRALLGFKLLAFNCYLATGWLIAKAFAARQDARPASAALVYLWNPLVLWEAIGNGHNDAVVALLLVAAMAAWLRGRHLWVIPALVAAVLLKYVAVILLPLALVAVVTEARKNGTLRRVLAGSTIVSVGIVVVALAPFYDLAAIRESVQSQGAFFATSPASVAIHWLQSRVAEQTVFRAVQAIGLAAVGATMLVWLRRIIALPARLPLAAFEVIFVFLLLATTNFRGWYLIWLVALAAMAASNWAVARSVAWSAGAMAAYPLLIWIWGWRGYTFTRVELIVVALMFLPPLTVSAAQVATWLWNQRNTAGSVRLSPTIPDDTAN
ncbi:MAG TPA: polyprenol phosphomannose-dependent alpha 1,6 mannosyltransferase MptB [Thermomicrobiales bacterium]|nr:polyprenol phosphomannose-dependent alpha 1,6 mannosyltransferase MptB [Thermomicrobiales bacterium]